MPTLHHANIQSKDISIADAMDCTSISVPVTSKVHLNLNYKNYVYLHVDALRRCWLISTDKGDFVPTSLPFSNISDTEPTSSSSQKLLSSMASHSCSTGSSTYRQTYPHQDTLMHASSATTTTTTSNDTVLSVTKLSCTSPYTHARLGTRVPLFESSSKLDDIVESARRRLFESSQFEQVSSMSCPLRSIYLESSNTVLLQTPSHMKCIMTNPFKYPTGDVFEVRLMLFYLFIFYC